MNPDELEARKQRIYNAVGPEALEVLKDAGLDIDAGVEKILKSQAEERGLRELATAVPTTENTMTSELVHLSKELVDPWGQEYSRRLGLIELSQEQIEALYHEEKALCESHSLAEEREQPWSQRYFIHPDTTPDNLPKPEELTLSELILITDDANSAIIRDHHALPDAAMNAAGIAACNRSYTEARYGLEFNDRTKRLGWSEPQRGAFCKNEFGITERFK